MKAKVMQVLKPLSLILLGGLMGAAVQKHEKAAAVVLAARECRDFCAANAPDDFSKMMCDTQCEVIIVGGECSKFPMN
jgi:hypothetical protein